MQDNIDFKGYFKLECVDVNDKVIDSYEDKNMIMTAARTSMAEIFANLSTSVSVEKFVLGTMGHVEADLLAAKSDVEGFVNTRDRLFSETGSTVGSPTNINDVLPILNINDVYYINSITGTPGFYRYLKASTTSYTVSEALVADITEWEFLHGTVAPYTYNITFDLPADSTTEITADNIVEDDAASGSTVLVHQTGTSLTFNVEIVPAAGNLQDLTNSVFTEAALYANGRIFSMKTFKGKIKDATVSLRVTWTITF